VSQTTACFNCGDTGRLKAQATRGDERRWFCHTAERSCYNERRGSYFDDNVIMTLDPAEAKVTIKNGAPFIEILLTEEHRKHIPWPEGITTFSIGQA
jgi:hypothetical protein